MTDDLINRLVTGAAIYRAEAESMAATFSRDGIEVRSILADAKADFAEAIVEALRSLKELGER